MVHFFGNLGISEITAGKIQEYRVHRHQETMANRGKPPAHSTLHQERVTLRQSLKTALRHGWLDRLLDFSEPYRSSPKNLPSGVVLTGEEYKKLYEATRKRAQEPKKKGFNWEAEQLHDFVLFAVNTRLRPDEAWRLEYRDVTVVDDEDLAQTILEIEVRGKRGVGYCKSMPGAVKPFERLRGRLCPARIDGVNAPGKSSVTSAAASEPWRLPEPTDLIFSEVAARTFQDHPRRTESSLRS